jgi:MFS family permease
MLKRAKHRELDSLEGERPRLSVHAARYATYTMFLADGLGFGIWAGHIPVFKLKFHLSDSSLSVALLAVALGAITSMPVAGQAVRHSGSRLVIGTSAACLGLCLAFIAVVPNFALFVILAFLFGAAKGALDIGINAQAVIVEKYYGRPIMSSFQALWSTGGLAGGLLTSAALALGSTVVINALCTGAVILLFDMLSYRNLLFDALPRNGVQRMRFRAPGKAFLCIAALTFMALLSEGVMQDWTAVYMRQVVAVSIPVAAIGYAGYSVAMALGRFLGDRIVVLFGECVVMRLSGGFITVGLIAVLLLPNPILAIAGFIVVGLGISNLVPILFGAAGRDPVLGPGPGIAAVTTVGYFGFLIGPPLIGFVSEFSSLSLALSLVALFGLIMATWGHAAMKPHALLRAKSNVSLPTD